MAKVVKQKNLGRVVSYDDGAQILNYLLRKSRNLDPTADFSIIYIPNGLSPTDTIIEITAEEDKIHAIERLLR